MTKDEAMKMAIEALEGRELVLPAIKALRQALEQEPWDTTDMAYRPGGLSMNLMDDQLKDLLTRIHHCMTHGYYFQNAHIRKLYEQLIEEIEAVLDKEDV